MGVARSLFGGDAVVQGAFFGLILAGAVSNMVGLLLVAVTDDQVHGLAAIISGIAFFVVGASIVGFFYLDPSLED